MTLEDFNVGQQVNVTYKPGSLFDHNFTGYVKEVNVEYVVVEDQGGDCWSCDPDQLSFSTDDIMHGNR